MKDAKVGIMCYKNGMGAIVEANDSFDLQISKLMNKASFIVSSFNN